MSKKEVYNTIFRTLNGKKGTGRKRSKKEIFATLQDYRKRTSTVEPNLDWEDYLNLLDISTHINANNAIDLAFRIGYTAGNTAVVKTSDREYELIEIIDETDVDLQKAITALEEFVNEYA